MSTSMTVSLVLTAVNNMPSVLQSAGRNVQGFAQEVSKAAAEVKKYDNYIANLEKTAKNFNNLKTSGMRDIQNGMMMLMPVEETLRHAANFEAVMTKVENALYDSTLPAAVLQEQMKGLTAQALELGNATTFNNMEAAEAQLALIRNGMTYQDVLSGGAASAMYLAQTAEIAPLAAADAVSQITNMFRLQGHQLLQVADDLNRAANASSAGVTEIMNDLQQAGMAANLLGLDVKETTLLLGTLHNMGLGGSSGNYLNDMLMNLDKVTPKARKALDAMGWLEGATVKQLKSGNFQVTGGINSLYNEAGQIQSAEHLVRKLREVLYGNSGLALDDLRDESGNLLPQEDIERLMEAKNKAESLQYLKDVFGIQGSRAAIALATPGKGSYEEMVEQAERAKRIEEQVLAWQSTLLGKVETLKGSWETLMTQSGTPLVNEVGQLVQNITNGLEAVSNWSNANPKLATSLLKLVGYIGLVRIGFGAGKVLFGGMGSLVTGAAKVLTYAARSAHGFYDTFKYFRQGSGVFRAIWSAVAFGSPVLSTIFTTVGRLGTGIAGLAIRAGKGFGTIISTVGRLGSSFLLMGSRALLAGIRVAAAWLIGLGPIGWIIAGATLLIAGGIAAWKTNFLGFRDFAIGVLEKIMGVINKVRTHLGYSAIELDILDRKTSMGDFKMLEREQLEANKLTPLLKTPTQTDNRSYIINVSSTDPQAAAAEISAKIPGMNKYTASRDPRLQDLGFAIP